MGINGIVSSYTTYYGGVPNRIHNVEVVSHLVDNTLIPPGKEFSFNGTTGERNAAKGLLEAPVIINGELENGLGGGTCQVSTTVFNAAYEAGLPITARTNHALYISHYPQGRDATVNYPDIDLKFVNDTGHWLLLRTFVSSSSLSVNLYGTPQHRRVVSETTPLRDHRARPGEVRRRPDPLRREEGDRGVRIGRRCSRRATRAGSTTRTASSCTRTPGTRATRARSRSSTWGRSRSRSEAAAKEAPCRPEHVPAARARADHTDRRRPATGGPGAPRPPPRRSPRRASRGSASAGTCSCPRPHAASSRPRRSRCRAGGRTRSGSAPRGRPRSGRGS